MSEKVPYTPSQTKRFEISPDEHSRTRVRFLRDLRTHLQAETGFEVGCALYGSLAKGKKLDRRIAARTDIDAIFYVDRDSVLQNFNSDSTPAGLKSDYNFVIGRWDRALGVSMPQIDFSKTQENDGQKINSTLGYVNKAIKKFTLDHIREYDYNVVYPPEAFVFPIALEGDYCVMDMIEEYEDAQKRNSEFDKNHWGLRFSLVFQLDLDGHLKKYRQAFMHQLAQKDPEERERIWRVVDSQMRGWERKGKIPENLESQFPDTFEKAYAYYKPHA